MSIVPNVMSEPTSISRISWNYSQQISSKKHQKCPNQALCLAEKLDRHRRIATTAYYRAEKRGFNISGDEIQD